MAKDKAPQRIVIESYAQMMDNRRVPRSLWRRADIFIGAGLIAMPFVSFGAYNKITFIGAGLGVAFMIAQRIISKDRRTYADEEPSDTRKRTCMIIRCITLLILLFVMFTAFGWGSGTRFTYPLRKALYSFANFSSSEPFEFMPDSLPDKTDRLKMNFVPPTAGQDANGHINITFFTDDDGVGELRDTALDKDGVLCDTESFEYKKLKTFCESEGLEIKGSEVYLVGEKGSHCPVYLVNEKTGLCVIYW